MKQHKREKEGESRKNSSMPEVVYTQPEPLDRKKLILRLVTAAAVVMALFVGFSIFFRVEQVEIIGMEKYTADTVMGVSGIEYGDSLLTFGKGKACAKIIEALPYVENVRIGIKLPGYVQIYIREVDVVYSIQDETDVWWLMTAEGRIVERISPSSAAGHTIIKGIRLIATKPGAWAEAMEPEPDETYLADGEEQIVVTVTNGERLQTVLDILDEMERNEILGTATTVDVTDMGDIQLWFGADTQVLLGDPSQLDMKIATMKGILEDDEIDSYGIIDLSEIQENTPISITPFQ